MCSEGLNWEVLRSSKVRLSILKTSWVRMSSLSGMKIFHHVEFWCIDFSRPIGILIQNTPLGLV